MPYCIWEKKAGHFWARAGRHCLLLCAAHAHTKGIQLLMGLLSTHLIMFIPGSVFAFQKADTCCGGHQRMCVSESSVPPSLQTPGMGGYKKKRTTHHAPLPAHRRTPFAGQAAGSSISAHGAKQSKGGVQAAKPAAAWRGMRCWWRLKPMKRRGITEKLFGCLLSPQRCPAFQAGLLAARAYACTHHSMMKHVHDLFIYFGDSGEGEEGGGGGLGMFLGSSM